MYRILHLSLTFLFFISLFHFEINVLILLESLIYYNK